MMKKSLIRLALFVVLWGMIAGSTQLPVTSASAVPPEISRIGPADYKETMQIFGEGLQDSEIYNWQPVGTQQEVMDSTYTLPQIAAVPTTPPAAAKKLAPLNPTVQVTAAQAVYSGVSIVWLKNAAGYSEPRIANQPEIWSQSSADALPGERVQLFGQNLYVANIQQIPLVILRNEQTNGLYQATWGLPNDQEMPNQNNHKFEFIVPGSIPAGSYQVFVHNGTGGVYGWSKPAALAIVASRDLIGMEVMAWNRVGVQTDLQTLTPAQVAVVAPANDEGLSDVTDSLQTAINNVAQAGGGIVELKAGTYGITRTLELKPGVVLKGAGQGATTLTVAYGKRLESWTRKPDDTPLVWIKTDAGLSDLHLLGGSGVSSLIVVQTFSSTPAKRVFMNRIDGEYGGSAKLLAGGNWVLQDQGILVLSGTEQLTIWQSKIVASSALRADSPRHVFTRLIGNHFEVSPRQGTINTVIKGMYNGMVAENTFLNGKRSFLSQLGFSSNWVFQNRSEGVGRGTNGQEEFMSEFGKANWLGQATSITDNTITVSAITYSYPLKYGGTLATNSIGLEHYLYIAEGRGLGQYRKVKSISNDGVFTLDQPWSVMPDASTKFAWMNMAVHNLWVNNTAENGSGISQFIYGSGVDNIIAGHEMLNNGGFSLWALDYQKDANNNFKEYGVLAFNKIVNNINRFSGSHNAGMLIWSKSGQNTVYADRPYTILGNIVRGNIVAGSSEAALFKNQTWIYWNQAIPNSMNFDPSKASAIELNGGFNLVEQNFILGLPNGIRVRGNGAGNMLRNNRIDYTPTPVLDETGSAIVNP